MVKKRLRKIKFRINFPLGKTGQQWETGAAPQKRNRMIDKFKNIFEGLTIAYGQYQKGEKGENGKQKGKAFIVRQQVTRELFENHIKGVGPALGIIPITEKNDCKWGCIDIDEYNLDHKSLISNIRNLNLPLIVCRSKSGGAHVFLFAKEFIPASSCKTLLKNFKSFRIRRL